MVTEIKVDINDNLAKRRSGLWNTTEAAYDMLKGLCKPTVSAGLYHKFEYNDGSVLVTSPWDSYASRECWCPADWNLDKHGHTPACGGR